MSDSSTGPNTGRTEQTTVATGSQPLRERLMPQTSIRFFLILISVCALVMLIFQSAVTDAGWPRIAALLIATIGGCFVAYAGLFLIGNLFSFTTAPIADAFEVADQSNANGPSQQAQERS